jgi:hypothetical protein
MPSQINAFNQARKIEAVGMQHLLPFFKEHSFEGRFVLTDKGPLARELQKMAGDVILTHHNGDTLAIECKIEKSSDYGNFFLETWSNRSRFTLGWMFTIQCAFLFYLFLDKLDLFIIPMQPLRVWAFAAPSKLVQCGTGRLFDYPEKRQGKYTQLNDTWGRCVPIHDLLSEILIRRIRLDQTKAS